ncbi:MAG: redoxin domain-containing protein [Planctomycetota bacterium]
MCQRFSVSLSKSAVYLCLVAFAVAGTGAEVFAQPLQIAKQRGGSQGALAVGDQAPDFELAVQGSDEYVSLSELIKDGPVVVVVLRGYPGYQCGICNQQVGSLINRSRTLDTKLGNKPKRVVLVYPGPELNLERHAKQFVGSRRIPEMFTMVRDPGMEMITSWGLRWDARRETAYPATYVIGPGRRVLWSKVSKSHGGRASVDEIVRAIDKI